MPGAEKNGGDSSIAPELLQKFGGSYFGRMTLSMT
jgi:hypothetical protein